MGETRIRRCGGDSCQQGRMPCRTPAACEVAEEDDGVDPLSFSWLLIAVALTGVAVIVGNLLFWIAEWMHT